MASSELIQDWAELQGDLLHSIVSLLGSFRDLLALASTCRPWRAALSSYPHKSTLYALCPPLLLRPDVPPPNPATTTRRNTLPATKTKTPLVCRQTPPPPASAAPSNRPYHFTDLACTQDSSTAALRSPQLKLPLHSTHYGNDATPRVLARSSFWGASFGHMILYGNRTCFVYNVLTGAVDVSSPPLPDHKHTEVYHGAALTAPLASPGPLPHLVVSTVDSNYFWRVGSGEPWQERAPGNGATLKRFALFKGQLFGLASDRRLFVVLLAPEVRLQSVRASWIGGHGMERCHLRTPWLVACGDMLLLVGCYMGSAVEGDIYEAYRLDTSTQPAKWVEVERLESWAIFISNDKRVQPEVCLEPERWGGKSGCVYCYGSGGHLLEFELGKPRQQRNDFAFIECSVVLRPMWVVPSMFSWCGEA